MTKPKNRPAAATLPLTPAAPIDCPLNPQWILERQVIYVGIDPGKTGAVGAIMPSGLAYAWRSPVLKVPHRYRSKKGKNQGKMLNSSKERVDLPGMASLIRGIAKWRQAGYRVEVAIEFQQAMPFSLKGMSQGASSTLNLGKNYGMWLGLLAAFKIQPLEVQPSVWKRALDLSQDKSLSVGKCQLLYPNVNLPLTRDVDRAEAVLLAHYHKTKASAAGASVRPPRATPAARAPKPQRPTQPLVRKPVRIARSRKREGWIGDRFG